LNFPIFLYAQLFKLLLLLWKSASETLITLYFLPLLRPPGISEAIKFNFYINIQVCTSISAQFLQKISQIHYLPEYVKFYIPNLLISLLSIIVHISIPLILSLSTKLISLPWLFDRTAYQHVMLLVKSGIIAEQNRMNDCEWNELFRSKEARDIWITGLKEFVHVYKHGKYPCIYHDNWCNFYFLREKKVVMSVGINRFLTPIGCKITSNAPALKLVNNFYTKKLWIMRCAKNILSTNYRVNWNHFLL
jgi:hypothetical protein